MLVVVLDDSGASIVDKPWQQQPGIKNRSAL